MCLFRLCSGRPRGRVSFDGERQMLPVVVERVLFCSVEGSRETTEKLGKTGASEWVRLETGTNSLRCWRNAESVAVESRNITGSASLQVQYRTLYRMVLQSARAEKLCTGLPITNSHDGLGP